MLILTFITTVILTWIKQYLVKVVGVKSGLADILFIVFCLSSPPLGILSSGYIVQKVCGGYQTYKSVIFVVINIFFCTVISVLIFFIQDPVVFVVLMWLFLFCGSAITPCLGGSVLSVLPLELKGSGFSLNMLLSNLLGRAPAPTVYGFLWDKYHDKYPSLAMTACLGTTCIGLVLMIFVLLIRKRAQEENREEALLKKSLLEPPEEVIEQAIENENIKEDI